MADNRITQRLFELKNDTYRDFHAKLMPNVEKDRVIGVRVPLLRKLAKEIDFEEAERFIKILPHKYYEENNLHAFIIENIKEYDKCVEEVNLFLPFVDNWATCDSLRPKCFKNHKEELLREIDKWLISGQTYTVRFAIEMLMVYFLDDDFDARYLKKVAEIKSEEYYINMMIAWFFATALAKRWEEAICYITEGVLPVWVNNKTIQKATESYRITKEQKIMLKQYKR